MLDHKFIYIYICIYISINLYSFCAFFGIINSFSLTSLICFFPELFFWFLFLCRYRHPSSSFLGFSAEGFFLYPSTPISFYTIVCFLFISRLSLFKLVLSLAFSILPPLYLCLISCCLTLSLYFSFAVSVSLLCFHFCNTPVSSVIFLRQIPTNAVKFAWGLASILMNLLVGACVLRWLV